jgi:hypothetical protein
MPHEKFTSQRESGDDGANNTAQPFNKPAKGQQQCGMSGGSKGISSVPAESFILHNGRGGTSVISRGNL